MKDKKLTRPSLQQVVAIASKLRKYLWLILLIFFVGIYGYMLLNIHSFMSEQPTQAQITSDLKTTPQPVINQQVVNQLESLQNNSVSVQSLFNQARQNPFQ